ncbi:ribonuclease E/G [Hellea balneolensis]|uniref:ribonuclease E/G n=1 Tax=Hellea balneolensis TaxID=287478 RepID=UPI0006887F30|nr:ribonuclease E/G [Hellea balneolensis]
MKRRCVIEEAIGETRAGIYEGRKLVELYVRRETDTGKPRQGDIFAGRVSKIDQSMGGAFIDIGTEHDGLFKFTNSPNAPRFTEGQMAEFEVSKATEIGKGPVLKFKQLTQEKKPAKLSGDDLKTMLAKRYEGIEFAEATVSVIDDATETELAIKGGGTISLERTRALVAIDVDKGTAVSSFDVCMAALPMIAHELRLRGLGGLIVIDLPNLRQPRQRNTVFKAAERAFADDPNNVKLAPLSRFGVLELTRFKPELSLDEVLNNRIGRPTTETVALRALRQLEREGRAHPGAKLTMTVRHHVMNWLEDGHIDWKAALTQRFGARFEVIAGGTPGIVADR